MSLRATVLIPTHDHGPTLRYSVQSALQQTVEDLEILVVGDGVPDVTRDVIRELEDGDDRVRFLDNPKGPRHGELHRHRALQEASGRIVCYLSDDDLWLREHVETMEALLAEADFAHALPLRIEPDGSVATWAGDLGQSAWHTFLRDGGNFIPLSCGAHTLDAYRRLPHGWRTTPSETWTDRYMWLQFLEQRWCRAGSGHDPTVLHLPSGRRRGWSLERRLEELETWWRRLDEPGFSAELRSRILAHLGTERSAHAAKVAEQAEEIEGLRTALAGTREQLEVALAETREQLEVARRELEGRRDELATIRATRTWRARGLLLRLPGVGRLLRSARAAPAARRGIPRRRPGRRGEDPRTAS